MLWKVLLIASVNGYMMQPPPIQSQPYQPIQQPAPIGQQQNYATQQPLPQQQQQQPIQPVAPQLQNPQQTPPINSTQTQPPIQPANPAQQGPTSPQPNQMPPPNLSLGGSQGCVICCNKTKPTSSMRTPASASPSQLQTAKPSEDPHTELGRRVAELLAQYQLNHPESMPRMKSLRRKSRNDFGDKLEKFGKKLRGRDDSDDIDNDDGSDKSRQPIVEVHRVIPRGI